MDGYQKIMSQGGILDRDQEEAINKYNEVVGSINFAKELLHGFNFFSEEVFYVYWESLTPCPYFFKFCHVY